LARARVDYAPSGGGKSSIFQALYWLLFGEAYKSANLDQLVN
jgi:hypothetical protein